MWITLQTCVLAFTLQAVCQAGKITESLECYDMFTDVVFVLDSSVSVWESNFTSQLNFVQILVETFSIGPHSVRVGVMTFGTDIRLDVRLNNTQTKNELKDAISKLDHLGFRQGTNTGAALEYARSQMFKTEHGERKDAKKILILITDGYSQNMTKTLWEATMAHSYDIEVFAIGVGGGTDDRELRGIGSEPQKLHVFHLDNYDALPNILKALENMVCERPSNDQHKAQTSEKQIRANCGGKPADVYFIVDGSASICKSHFDKQLAFIKDVISFFDLGEDRTRVGVVTFSDSIHPIIPLNGSYKRSDLEDMIDNVPYKAQGTNTGGAIRYLTNHGFSKQFARQDVAHVAILMTDGQSENLAQTKMESRRGHKAGIYLFAIGIGDQTDLGELKDIASDPDQDFMFKVDDYEALNSIKNLLAIKACQLPLSYQRDQQATCQFTKETDAMFGFDSGAVGRHHTRMVEHFIGEIVREMDKHHVTRVGILRESCPRDSDVSLSQSKDSHVFKRHMNNNECKGLQPLIHKLRRKSFKLPYGRRRHSSEKIAVLFVDDKLDNARATIQEAKRAKFINIRMIIVAIGHHYNETELQSLATDPPSRFILHVDGYKNLKDVKESLLNAMCAGPHNLHHGTDPQYSSGLIYNNESITELFYNNVRECIGLNTASHNN